MYKFAFMICCVLIFLYGNLLSSTFSLGNRNYQIEGGSLYKNSSGEKTDRMYPYRLIVRKLDRERPLNADFQNLNLSGVIIFQDALLADYYIIEIDIDKDPFLIATTLFSSSEFEYVEFAAIAKYSSTPNDEYFDTLWALQDDKLQLADAWNISTGDSLVIVGNIDSGVEYAHEDLVGNIW